MRRRLHIDYHVEPDAEALACMAAGFITSAIEAAVSRQGYARIAISGGSTPKATYGLLADAAQPWRSRVPYDKLDLYWTDERAVSPEHADSNYRMAYEAWLAHVPLNPRRIHRIKGELEPQTAADRYQSELLESFGINQEEIPHFDLVALGMGADGHTASLFPFTDVLHERDRLVMANYVPQKTTWRITLTAQIINKASSVFFLIAGADKARVLKDVVTGPPDFERLPSQLIQPAGGILTLLLDRAAAEYLPATDGQGHGFVEREI
jgi:6-phosphogluconolactonase